MGCCCSHEEGQVIDVPVPISYTVQETPSPSEHTTAAPLPSAPSLSLLDLHQLYLQSFLEEGNYSPEQNPTDPQ